MMIYEDKHTIKLPLYVKPVNTFGLQVVKIY